MAAADRGAQVQCHMLQLQAEDLRGAVRRGMESNLIVFVVDSSGSMAGRDRLSAVTGAVGSLLRDAYQRRDKVAVISVRGKHPDLVLPPTGSIDVASRRLAHTPTGGRTPLGEGLIMAHKLCEREHRKDPTRRPLLVILSDGRATGRGGVQGMRMAARQIARRGLAASVVIDCERSGRVRLGLARELATELGGACVRLDEMSAQAIQGVIHAQ